MSHPSGLPLAQNIITTHTLEGDSIFLPEPVVASTPVYKPIGPTKSVFADLHQAPSFPPSLTRSSPTNDIASTVSLVSENKIPNLTPASGIRFCRTDTPPGGISPFHRTLSLDYGVIVEGEMELILENGEKKLLKAGDTVVQRATMHQWRNPSQTEWCRMIAVMVPIESGFRVGEKVAETEFRIPGAKPA
jgi:quercetin dioxygenase-like cupin family protein